MKAFVRNIEESKRWFVAVIGVLGVALFLAGEATNGLAYLPVYVVFAIPYGKDALRWIATRKRSRALLGEARSTGNR
jgi:hypothetical protein